MEVWRGCPSHSALERHSSPCVPWGSQYNTRLAGDLLRPRRCQYPLWQKLQMLFESRDSLLSFSKSMILKVMHWSNVHHCWLTLYIILSLHLEQEDTMAKMVVTTERKIMLINERERNNQLVSQLKKNYYIFYCSHSCLGNAPYFLDSIIQLLYILPSCLYPPSRGKRT